MLEPLKKIKPKMEGLYLKACVGKRLKQYLENSFNDEIIRPKKDSNLINIIKPYLILRSNIEIDAEDYPEDECILIELPLSRSNIVYSVSGNKVYFCETLWRNQLSETGHKKVRKFVENTFRKTFHTFMDGYIEGQYAVKKEEMRIKVKSGVVAFLTQYHIEFDEQMVSTLTRDWWRHNDRTEKYMNSPALE